MCGRSVQTLSVHREENNPKSASVNEIRETCSNEKTHTEDAPGWESVARQRATKPSVVIVSIFP